MTRMNEWLRDSCSQFGALYKLALNLVIFGNAGLMAATNPPDPRDGPVLREIPLADAIRQLGGDANLDLVFADDLVKDVHILLEAGKPLTAGDLDGLLESTALGWKLSPSNRLIFFTDRSKAVRKVSGFVIAARGGGAIVNAKVFLSGTRRFVRTDATGAFSFSGVPMQFKRLEIEAANYRPCQIDLVAMGDKDLLIILKPPFEVSENLRVFSPKRTHLSISPLSGKLSFTANETFQEGPPGWDLFDSLKEIPGIAAGRDEAGLEFRGGQPSENLVLLDGIQLFQFDHALGSFSAFNADAIGEIEVFKGGYPANYGDRLAGVLALTTREDVFDRRELRAGIDRDKVDLTFQSPLGDRLAVLVSARSSVGEDISNTTYERRFETTFNDDEPLGEEGLGLSNFREIKFSDFIGKVAWRPGELNRVNLTFFTGEDDVVEGVNYDLIGDAYYRKSGVLSNQGTSLFWGRVWSASFDTEVRISNSKYQTDFETREIDWPELQIVNGQPVAPYPFRYSTKENVIEDQTFNFEAHWLAHPDHQIHFGITSSRKELLQKDVSWRSGTSESSQETELNSLYFQDLWQLNSKWSGLFGLRTAENELTSTTFLEPRFSLQYQPKENWNLRGAWGKYHQHLLRSPDSLNYFYGIETWFLAAGDLEPGESQHYQLGTGWRKGLWTVDFEMYRRLQRGGLFRGYDPLLGNFSIRQSRDKIEGFDLLLRRGKGQFSTFLGYSYQNAKVLEDLTYRIPTSYATDRSRPHQLNLALNYSRGLWRMVLAWRFATGIPYNIPLVGTMQEDGQRPYLRLFPPRERNTRRLPDTHQLDARLQYSFGGKRVSGNLGLYLFNVYDRDNTLYRYYTLEDTLLVPVNVPGFGFRPSLRLQIVY